jgi:hypothetical protein
MPMQARLARALNVVCSLPYPNQHRHVNQAQDKWYLRIDRRWRAVVEMDFVHRHIQVRAVVHRKNAYR